MRAIAILLTLGLAFFILVAVALIAVGPTLGERVADALHVGAAFEWTWKILQWPVIFAIAATAIGIVYYFAPDAEQDWVWLTPGAAFATLLWIAASLALKYYLLYVGNFNETYGTIGAVMVLLLWFFVTAMAILVGAELNAEIEHASPYGKAPGEKSAGTEEEARRRRRAVLRRVQSQGTREVTLNCAGARVRDGRFSSAGCPGIRSELAAPSPIHGRRGFRPILVAMISQAADDRHVDRNRHRHRDFVNDRTLPLDDDDLAARAEAA